MGVALVAQEPDVVVGLPVCMPWIDPEATDGAGIMIPSVWNQIVLTGVKRLPAILRGFTVSAACGPRHQGKLGRERVLDKRAPAHVPKLLIVLRSPVVAGRIKARPHGT